MIINKNISIQDLAALVATHLMSKDIHAVLVGGGCVTIYSQNRFMSYDLDFISYSSLRKIKLALSEIGFVFDDKKYFTHPNTEFFLDFLSPPISVGNEPIQVFQTLQSPVGELKLLTPTDCVKDRLAAYFHWDDQQSLFQAVGVSKEQKIDLNEVTRWAKQENQTQKLQKYFDLLEEGANEKL